MYNYVSIECIFNDTIVVDICTKKNLICVGVNDISELAQENTDNITGADLETDVWLTLNI